MGNSYIMYSISANRSITVERHSFAKLWHSTVIDLFARQYHKTLNLRRTNAQRPAITTAPIATQIMAA